MARRGETTDGPLTLRDRQRQFTRERFVMAAAAEFQTRGYAATTIDDIVVAAGATRATFYLHFASKADVIPDILENLNSERSGLDAQLTTAVSAGSRDSLRSYLDAAFDYWETIRNYAVALEEAATLDAGLREARAAAFDAHVGLIVEGLREANRFDESSRRVRAVLAYSQFLNVFHRWMRVGWDIDRGETLEVMTDMWMAGLGPAASTSH